MMAAVRACLAVAEAAAALKQGQVIAYPTEAVYGLGCDPCNPWAVAQVLALKGRAHQKGLILLASDLNQLEGWIDSGQTAAVARARATWPGPFTWVFRAHPRCDSAALPGDGTVAVRVSAHPVAAALARAFGGLIVSTSANPQGQLPASTLEQLQDYFGAGLAVVAGAVGGHSAPSEIRRAADGQVLRS